MSVCFALVTKIAMKVYGDCSMIKSVNRETITEIMYKIKFILILFFISGFHKLVDSQAA